MFTKSSVRPSTAATKPFEESVRQSSPITVDLAALLQSLCDDAAETGQEVSYQWSAGAGILVMGQPNRLGRVFENLIDNAVKYGGHAIV